MSARTVSLALAILCILAGALSLYVGPADLLALADSRPDLARTILWEIRVPRTLLCVLVGAVLGASGAALQGLLRNPLASPDILGTSAGGALGAVAAAYFLGAGGAIGSTLGGMAGAALALALLLLLAGRGAATTTLILAGVAISALAAALMNLALALAPSPFALYDIIFWLLGSFEDRTPGQLFLGAPFMIAGLAGLLFCAPALGRLALGEDVAETLGVSVKIVRLAIVIASGIAVGAAVSLAGAVGFIGLVVPHLVRPLLDERPGAAILPSALGGGALLTLADLISRIPVDGRTLPIGVITALVGAPFFLALILRRRSVR